MNNNQNIYLDKVIEFLVRDTKIDFKEKEIFFPPFLSSSPFSLLLFSSSSLSPLLSLSLFSPSFSKYCKEVYGLTDQEMEYVWIEYKTIIKIKIENGR